MRELIHRRQFSALPGVEQFVRSLWRKRGLAICSGALREEIEAMLEGISLRECFPVIVAAEDVTVGKPDPQGYLMSIKLLGEKMHRHLKPFFFQAEDGIRDGTVTGVQTCALPICGPDGLTAGRLSHRLFGDADHVVTVRAEISRLRRAIGALVTTNPYRLAAGVTLRVVQDRKSVV